jgi:hypothetical protein
LIERWARVFVQQALESRPGQLLTAAQAYDRFCDYLRTKEMKPLPRRQFSSMFAPLIRDSFDLGLRKDILNSETQKQTSGWKGLMIRDLEVVEKGVAEAPTQPTPSESQVEAG